jgi:hypothetical protein
LTSWDSVLSICKCLAGSSLPAGLLNGANARSALNHGTSDKCVLDKIINLQEGLKQSFKVFGMKKNN